MKIVCPTSDYFYQLTTTVCHGGATPSLAALYDEPKNSALMTRSSGTPQIHAFSFVVVSETGEEPGSALRGFLFSLATEQRMYRKQINQYTDLSASILLWEESRASRKGS